ncbi:MAG: ABC transporter ATP-binding protein [Planctomycetota bacterium]|jgi:putative ABC transport system ATP-binding protein|nr:ABC transporter ATP-binding protein [Planctomycetota bacterium]
MSVLDVRGLCKEYVRGGVPFRAVDSANLRVEPGEMVGIVGRSGSGKTTFFNMVAGLLTPSAGSVSVAGTDILALSDAERSELRNRRIGYVPQGQSLLANLTVLDNVRLPHYFAARDDNVAGRVFYLLGELGIAHLAETCPPQLSGGEMRRAAIARAMMNRPELLLADEPTGDLDAGNARAAMDAFAALAASGVAVVFSAHGDDAARRADRVVEMERGAMRERTFSEA